MTAPLGRVTVAGFKSLGNQYDLEIELRGSTAVIGENGVGKSSVLDAIQFALVRDWQATADRIGPTWSDPGVTVTTVSVELWGLDDAGCVKVEASLVRGVRTRRVLNGLGEELGPRESENVLSRIEVARLGDVSSKLQSHLLSRRLLRDAISDDPAVVALLGSISKAMQPVIHTFSAAAAQDASDIVGSDLTVGFTTFPEDLVEAVQLRLGRAVGPSLGAADDHVASLGAVALAFLRRLAERPGAYWVLLWDEPETGLHPVAQARLADYMLRHLVGRTIVATHSPFIWTEFRRKGSVVGLRRGENGLSIEYDPAEQGVLVSLLPHQSQGTVARMVQSPLDDRPVVLVEGATDRRYLQAALEAAHAPEIEAVECGGAFSLVPMASALFHISKRRLLVVLDADRDGRSTRDVLKKYGFPSRMILMLAAFSKNSPQQDMCAEDLVDSRDLDQFVADFPEDVLSWSREVGRIRYRFTPRGKVALCERVCQAGGPALGGWHLVAERVITALSKVE